MFQWTWLAAVLSCASCVSALDIDRLSDSDIRIHNSILSKFTDQVEKRRPDAVATLTLEQLYKTLNDGEMDFLGKLMHLDPNSVGIRTPYLGLSSGEKDIVPIRQKFVAAGGKQTAMAVQYLPRIVYEQYKKMAQAMQAKIGRRIYLESGYRGSAYQLYLFLASLRRREYSIRETVRFVALPGYSEHGAPWRQAIDLMTQDGLNVDTPPERYERSPEFQWLAAHAREYGFVLSYPKNNPHGISYEPWHWHFDKSLLPAPPNESSAIPTADPNLSGPASRP